MRNIYTTPRSMQITPLSYVDVLIASLRGPVTVLNSEGNAIFSLSQGLYALSDLLTCPMEHKCLKTHICEMRPRHTFWYPQRCVGKTMAASNYILQCLMQFRRCKECRIRKIRNSLESTGSIYPVHKFCLHAPVITELEWEVAYELY